MLPKGNSRSNGKLDEIVAATISKVPAPEWGKSTQNEVELPRILAIGGGKGGVGKTMVAAALGICLASLGKKTVIVDADFAGANLHTCLDIINPNVTFKDFFEKRHTDINSITLETSFKNLRVISGAPGVLGMGNFMYWEKLKLMRHIRKLQTEYVILDLGAGTAYNEIDLFLLADQGVLVSNANGMALQETFNFIKIAIFRKLKHTFRECPEVLEVLSEYSSPSLANRPMSIPQMLEDIEQKTGMWVNFVKHVVDEIRPNFVLNMKTEPSDAIEVQALRNVTREILGVYLNYWGEIRYDEGVRRAIRQMRPDLLLSPEGFASEDVLRLVSRNILKYEKNSELQLKNVLKSSLLYRNSEEFQNIRICNYRCIAWNCCRDKQGGLPCTVIGSSIPRKESIN